MKNRADIRKALEEQLVTVTGLPDASHRAYEGVEYTPTRGEAWVRMNLIPLTDRPAVIGLNPETRADGLFQVSIFQPTGTGPANADTLADAICDAFPAGTILTSGGVNTRIEYAESGQGFTESPWYMVPVDIYWYSYRN